MKKPIEVKGQPASVMHTKMEEYAKKLKKPNLELYLTHLNEVGEPIEELFETFERVTKDCSYKACGETYEVQVDTGKFDPAFTATYEEEKERDFKGFSSAEIKQRFKEDPRWHDELVSYRFNFESL